MRALVVGRIRLVAMALVIVAAILVGRLYVIQVVRGEDYAGRADRQYVRPQEGLFARGSIFFEDKNGKRISAATVKSGFALFINPNVIEEPEELYEKLSQVIELDREEFLVRASKKNDPYEVVAHRVSESIAAEVENLNLEGVQFYKEQWRYYPGNDLAAQVLGFVAYKGDELSGRYGVEREYEGVLGRDENAAYVNFFAEVFSNIADLVIPDRRASAGDVVLTVEPSTQVFLQQIINEVVSDWNGRAAGGLILHPTTGVIYAMAAHPSFDLNDFQNVSGPSVFSNPLVESIFEMGSIIKPFTMSIGLDTNSVTADTIYEDRG